MEAGGSLFSTGRGLGAGTQDWVAERMKASADSIPGSGVWGSAVWGTAVSETEASSATVSMRAASCLLAAGRRFRELNLGMVLDLFLT
jgi:hypothetical protein